MLTVKQMKFVEEIGEGGEQNRLLILKIVAILQE
tara:strand:- start:203 stop:304 length:102 start_codon:yes stop_codon:yes gene_type:complete